MDWWSWVVARTARTRPEQNERPVPYADSAPVQRQEWTGLPPLQRTFNDVELAAPLDPFTDGLSSRQSLSMLGPMEHLVHSDAPSGVAMGLAAPTAPRRMPIGADLVLPAPKELSRAPRTLTSFVQRLASGRSEAPSVELPPATIDSPAVPLDLEASHDFGPGASAEPGPGPVPRPGSSSAESKPQTPTVSIAPPNGPATVTAALPVAQRLPAVQRIPGVHAEPEPLPDQQIASVPCATVASVIPAPLSLPPRLSADPPLQNLRGVLPDVAARPRPVVARMTSAPDDPHPDSVAERPASASFPVEPLHPSTTRPAVTVLNEPPQRPSPAPDVGTNLSPRPTPASSRPDLRAMPLQRVRRTETTTATAAADAERPPAAQRTLPTPTPTPTPTSPTDPEARPEAEPDVVVVGGEAEAPSVPHLLVSQPLPLSVGSAEHDHPQPQAAPVPVSARTLQRVDLATLRAGQTPEPLLVTASTVRSLPLQRVDRPSADGRHTLSAHSGSSLQARGQVPIVSRSLPLLAQVEDSPSYAEPARTQALAQGVSRVQPELGPALRPVAGRALDLQRMTHSPPAASIGSSDSPNGTPGMTSLPLAQMFSSSFVAAPPTVVQRQAASSLPIESVTVQTSLGLESIPDAASGAITDFADAAGGVSDSVGAGIAAASAAIPSAAPAAPAAPGTSGADIDELARRLFEPLSARLRSELWLDRERAGLSIELRR